MEIAVERGGKRRPVGSGIRWTSVVTTLLGIALIMLLHWMVFSG